MGFISPAALPTITNAPQNFHTALSNQLASQLGKLFQDLFPIDQSFQYESVNITNEGVLAQRMNQILDDIGEIKVTILTINQITNIATSRIPSGFSPGGPNSDPSNIAGLNTNTNNNPVINTLDNLYTDVVTGAFGAAQSDYAALRNQLIPYFNL